MKTIARIRAFGLGLAAFVAFGTARAGDTVQTDNSKNEKKPLIEQPDDQWWGFNVETGYKSKYIFRGNDLTHDSGGISFEDLSVSFFPFKSDMFKNDTFKLGIYGIQMLGEGHTTGDFIFQQTGGDTHFNPGSTYFTNGVDPGPVRYQLFFKSTIERFNEYDIFEQYTHAFGPVKVTLGSVLFLVDSRTTFESSFIVLTAPQLGRGLYPNTSTKDVSPAFILRPFISLSTDVIPHVVPSLTYYENAYEYKGGDGDAKAGAESYMEGKLNGSWTLAEHGPIRVSADPYATISVSFRDRSHLGVNKITQPLTNSNGTPLIDPTTGKQVVRYFDEQGDTLYTGFQHFQTGVEFPVQFNKYLSLVPFASYVHLFSLVPGDRRDTYFAGASVRVGF